MRSGWLGRRPAGSPIELQFGIGEAVFFAGCLGSALYPVLSKRGLGREWLSRGATAVLTPGAVTAYSYLVPFVSMLLLLVGQPASIAWIWLPGSVLVMLAIALLLHLDTTKDATARPGYRVRQPPV